LVADVRLLVYWLLVTGLLRFDRQYGVIGILVIGYWGASVW
jgi:hypothetical protein